MRTVSMLAAALIGCNGDDDKDDAAGTTGHTGATTPLPAAWNVVGDAATLPPASILSIWGSASDNVWLVGADDGTGPLVYHFDGTAWTRLATGSTGDLWWVWSDGADTVMMSGANGRMITHTISTGGFSEVVATDPTYILFGTWGTSPTDLWTVGGDINNNLPGAVSHYDGAAWTESTTAPPDGATQRESFKVWGAAADDVWVVGTGALAMHWDGAAWDLSHDQPVYGTTTLVTVHGRASDDIYAVGGFGNGVTVHYDGTTWTEESPPPMPGSIAPAFNGVYASAADGTVTCGRQGSIWWHGDTHEWTADSRGPATARDFHACWIDETGEPWAVGGDLTSNAEGVVITGNPNIPPI